MPLKNNVANAANLKEANKVYLELSLYTNYSHGGKFYQKGTAYAFTPEQALDLLSDRDPHNGSIWKRYNPLAEKAAAEKKAEKKIVDASNDLSTKDLKMEGGPAPKAPEPPKVIELGDESELAELNLNDDEENVTV